MEQCLTYWRAVHFADTAKFDAGRSNFLYLWIFSITIRFVPGSRTWSGLHPDFPVSVKAVNDRGIGDDGCCETLHLAPNQFVNLRQILQHDNDAGYGNAYYKESDEEDGTKLDFGLDGKLSSKDDWWWNAH